MEETIDELEFYPSEETEDIELQDFEILGKSVNLMSS
jgi:hypothetical protein